MGTGQPGLRQFEVERYLEHQGTKFNMRFDAASYVRLTQLMDTHDLGRGERNRKRR